MAAVRIWAGSILLSLLSPLLCVPAVSQIIPGVQADAESRFVSREEGEAIVWVAWELRRGLDSKPDCSHFVNLVYARAGLDYEYADAGSIFDGIDGFQRVHEPQAGDLVAWKGHVGLVVDPAEHSFYSSVRSGFAIENYRSDYWANRGQPRFYRYLIDEIHSTRLAAHLKALPLVVPATPSVSSGRLPPETQPESPVPSSPRVRSVPVTKEPEDDTEVSDAVFVSINARPSKDEILVALLHLADENAEHVLQLQGLRPSRTVVVAEQVKVGQLSIDDYSGWAQLEAQAKGAFPCLQSNVSKTVAKWRMALRHEERGWILLAPRDRIYLRRDVAARALEHPLPTDAARTVAPIVQARCKGD